MILNMLCQVDSFLVVDVRCVIPHRPVALLACHQSATQVARELGMRHRAGNMALVLIGRKRNCGEARSHLTGSISQSPNPDTCSLLHNVCDVDFYHEHELDHKAAECHVKQLYNVQVLMRSASGHSRRLCQASEYDSSFFSANTLKTLHHLVMRRKIPTS